MNLFNIFRRKKEAFPETKRAYAMAQISRQLNDWNSFVRSINYDIKSGGKQLRDRARDMAKNDPYTRKYLSLVKRNIIGPNNFTLRVKAGDYTQDETGNLTFELDKIANREITDAWWQWGKKKYCTVEENISFRELSQVIIETVFQDGELFIHRIKGNVNKFGYSLQLITADYLDESYNEVLSNGNVIIMGIEYTKERKPVRYWFTERNPLDDVNSVSRLSTIKRVPIPAENICHLFIRETADQLRGVTQLAPVAIRLKMLMGWDEAAVTNARASACQAGVLEPKDNADGAFDGYEKDTDGNVVNQIEPNELFIVPDGYNYKIHNPVYPHSQHAPFNKTMLKGISSGLDVSYHDLASDYEGVNYTSSRTALLDERDHWRNKQSWWIEHFLEDIYSDFLEMAILSGQLSLSIRDFDKYNVPHFIPRSWSWVDPQNEVNANKLALETYQTTHEQILSERSMDLEETLEQIAYERELFKKYNLPLIGALTPAPPPSASELEEDTDAEKHLKVIQQRKIQ